MSIEKVNAELSKETREALFAIVPSIREKLPFLIELSPSEKRKMSKIGDKNQLFVEKVLELAKRNPGFLPRDFDVEGLEKDYNLFKDLSNFLSALKKLIEEVEDTATAVGSDAYSEGLIVYDYVKAKGKATAGLEGAAKELKRWFARAPKSSKPNKSEK